MHPAPWEGCTIYRVYCVIDFRIRHALTAFNLIGF